MDFTSGSNNHISEATRVNWGVEELAQRSKRRKIDIDEENSKNKTKNILLYISGEDGIYHAENTTLLPHVSNQRHQEDTIYLPLKSCVFINLTSYDEIVINKGTFFFGDEKGVYVNSCAGKSFSKFEPFSLKN